MRKTGQLTGHKGLMSLGEPVRKSRQLTGEQEQMVYEIMTALNAELRRDVLTGLITAEQLEAFLALPKGPRTAKLKAIALSLFD